MTTEDTTRCRGNDPACPCQDGDVCHYADDPKTSTAAWPIPNEAQRVTTTEDNKDQEALDESARADVDYPEEPLSPEFRARLLRTVGEALRIRRYTLNLAGMACGHRKNAHQSTCNECRERWPCATVRRGAAPILDYIAESHPSMSGAIALANDFVPESDTLGGGEQ